MLTRELSLEEKDRYNAVATHPLQSWQWGDFRESTGVAAYRFGTFNDVKKLVGGFQVLFHKVPKTSYTIGYVPRGPLPNKVQLEQITRVAAEQNAIFVKLEPNIIKEGKKFILSDIAAQFPNFRISSKPLFTPYTFQLDLTPTEDQLMAGMNQKTRYNVRLAQKKGVTVTEDNSDVAFAAYLKLTNETTKRQKFFAHNEQYHRAMWKFMKESGIAHLLVARYQNEILVTWIVFLFNNVLYYPYGASSEKFREVMASNAMMWETIRWGKQQGAKLFDMWGALGPSPAGQPNTKDPWYGFHRFKEGYGGKPVEFVGSYDLVLQPKLYKTYLVVDKLRWAWLKGSQLLWSVPELW